MAVYQDFKNEEDKKRNKPIKTKDGRSWYFRYYYTDLLGNKKQKKSGKYLRKKDAEEAEDEFKNSLKDLAIKKNITFKELKQDYLNYQKDKIKITSYQSLTQLLNHLDILDNIEIEKMTIKQFDNWKDVINSHSYSTTYKNNIYKRLRSLMNYGSKMYNIDTRIMNRFTNFTNPNELKKEMLYYTKEEFNDFISQENDIKWICFFSTLFYCGLRQGEALALNWKDIDFNTKSLKITKSLANRIKGQKYTILPPKTRGSYRTIPIPPNLFNNLKKLLEEQKQYANFNYDWFIFGNVFPLAPTTIQVRRDKLCKLANVKKIRIHDFRHSCASLLINNGANVNLVARYLGHENITTTLNTYSHFYQSDLTLLVKNIEN